MHTTVKSARIDIQIDSKWKLIRMNLVSHSCSSSVWS